MSAGRVARHQQRARFELADAEGLAVPEQVVELAAVGQEGALEVVDLLERRLDLADVLADGDAPADLLLQVARAGQVVGMRVGLENPLRRQVLGRGRRRATSSAARVSVCPDLKS